MAQQPRQPRQFTRFYEPRNEQDEQKLDAIRSNMWDHSQLPSRSLMILIFLTMQLTDLDQRIGRVSEEELTWAMGWRTKSTLHKHLDLVKRSGEAVFYDVPGDTSGDLHYRLPVLPVEWPEDVRHLARVRGTKPGEEE